MISAYACESGRGSEGEIGWRLIVRLAERHNVWVITRANLRVVHEAAFQVTPKPEHLHFVYFDLPWIFRFYKKGARLFLVYYYLWQIGIGFEARRLSREIRFDVLHHLTGGMDWMPSGLALASGPFVWGPVGSENTHPLMRRYLSLGSRVKDSFRLVVRGCLRNLDPLVLFTGWRARVILTHTLETMPPRYIDKMRPFTQTGIENSRKLALPKTALDRGKDLKLVYAGELKDWKGARLALEAALGFFETDPKATLQVIGDGPLRNQMEAISNAHSEGQRVHFLGRLPMEVLLQELNAADIFLYPSFHHGLATVVLQAMLTGLPIVCIGGDAIARAVGSRAGIAVQLSVDNDPVEGLVEALIELANDESKRMMRADAAQKIALQEYQYNHLADRISEVYKRCAAQTIIEVTSE